VADLSKLNFGKAYSNDPKEILHQLDAAFHNSQKKNMETLEDTKMNDLHQPIIFYTFLVKRGWPRKPISVTVQFPSPNVFVKSGDAELACPYFLRDLIQKGNIPEDVILDDKTIDPTRIEFAIGTVTLTFMERIIQENGEKLPG
jgi:hypothetical protein